MNKQLVENIQSQTKRFFIFPFPSQFFQSLISQLKELDELKAELDPAEYELFLPLPPPPSQKNFKFYKELWKLIPWINWRNLPAVCRRS